MFMVNSVELSANPVITLVTDSLAAFAGAFTATEPAIAKLNMLRVVTTFLGIEVFSKLLSLFFCDECH